MASAGRNRLAYMKEATYGVAPGTLAMKSVPFNTGDMFVNNRSTQTSGEVQATRKPRTKRPGNNAPEKTINTELQWENHDDLFAAGFGDTWCGGFTETQSVTATTGAVFTDASGDAWITDLGFEVGNFVLYDDDGTDKVLYASAFDDDDMTLIQANGSTAATITAVSPAASKTFIVGCAGGRIDASANNLTFSNSSSTVTVGGSGVSWLTLGFVAGDNIYFDGTSNNEGWHKISSLTATVLTLATAPTDESLSSGNIDFMNDAGYIRNGNDLWSFTMEEAQLDHDSSVGNYREINGVKISQIAYNFQVEAFPTVTFTLMGATIGAWGNTEVNDSITSYTSRDKMSTFTGQFDIDETTAEITSYQATLNNSNNRNFVLFNRNATAMTNGIPEITGTMGVYFEDDTYSDMFHGETEFDTFLRSLDPDGNAYCLRAYNNLYTGDTISVGDIDVTESLPFTVQPASSGSEIEMRRQPAAR